MRPKVPVRIAAATAATAAALAAGCGGGSTSSKSYSVDTMASCLRDSGATVSDVSGDLYIPGGAGTLTGELGENSLTIAFGQSEDDAKRFEAAFRSEFGSRDVAVREIQRRRNAVILWHKTPTEDERIQVSGCL